MGRVYVERVYQHRVAVYFWLIDLCQCLQVYSVGWMMTACVGFVLTLGEAGLSTNRVLGFVLCDYRAHRFWYLEWAFGA